MFSRNWPFSGQWEIRGSVPGQILCSFLLILGFTLIGYGYGGLREAFMGCGTGMVVVGVLILYKRKPTIKTEKRTVPQDRIDETI